MTKVLTSKVNGEFTELAKEIQKNNDAALAAIKDSKKLPDVRKELTTEYAEKLLPKKRISEEGHANMVFNFDLLIASVVELGILFAPSNPLIKLLYLNEVLEAAQQSLEDVNTMFNTLKRLLDERQELYERMLTTATRMMGELRSCGASQKTIDKAMSYKRKLDGKKLKKVNANATDKEISAAQTSFAQRFNNFDGLIGVCALEPSYDPSIDDLKITDLKASLLNIRNLNSSIAKAKAKLKKARTTRNKTLYNPVTGMVDIALAVKEYVKSVFGYKSPEYKEVNHISFKNLIKL